MFLSSESSNKGATLNGRLGLGETISIIFNLVEKYAE